MSYWPRFIFPYALLLLALLPITIIMAAQIKSLGVGRKSVVLALRTLMLTALICALAGMEIVYKNDKLAVFFLIDQSNSIPEQAKLAAVQAIRTTADLYMEDNDEAGVIVFGENASIELSVDERLGLTDIQSNVRGEQSDLAAALRLAMAAFPESRMKRVVLFTDGNETQGSMIDDVKLARANGTEINVVPLQIESGNEVRIAEVSAPASVNADEPFHVQVTVRSDSDTEGTLHLTQRVGGTPVSLPPQKVTLKKGDNVFLLGQELDNAGFYEYEAVIESEDDSIFANNEGRAFSVVYGEPTVLYVESDSQNSTFLSPALEREGVKVVQTDPLSMPGSLAQLQNFDAIVLSDVSATDLTSGQMRSVQAAVRDLGIGLVMIGGPNTFGAGGFHESPIEEALPVSTDLKQRKVLPRGALALVLHTCEIPDGNAWARTIGIAALDVLASQDLMGALAYTYAGNDDWLFELQPVSDKSMMRRALNRTDIGDMPNVGPTLAKAYKGLVNVEAAVKRIVVISDGDPAAPPGSLVAMLSAANIAVSTVCIAPHSLSDQSMLRTLAERTGGNYYFVNNPNNLPQIFTKEAAIVKRGMLIEEEFTPVPYHDSELLISLGENGYPNLFGYVATTAKDTATVPLMSHEEDPVLAHWRYGLGKSVAYTSDVTTRWAQPWVNWEGFGSFWAQGVRWAMRDLSKSAFQVDTAVRDGRGTVRIDAVDEQGRFINGLRPQAIVTGPAPEFERSVVDFQQTGPGIYESSFPATNRGVYMVNVTYTDSEGREGMVPTGLAVGYSREYEFNTANRSLIEQIAEYGGGAVIPAVHDVFQNDMTPASAVTPIWPWLVVFAACIFPIEIFVRRVVIDYAGILARVLSAFRRIPGLNQLIRPPSLRPQMATGSYGSGEARQFGYQPATEDFEYDATTPPDGAPGAPVAAKAEAPAKPKDAGSDYTRQLLAAKERALHNKRRPSSGDKEDS